jgi:hypothetical protein
MHGRRAIMRLALVALALVGAGSETWAQAAPEDWSAVVSRVDRC